MAIEIRTLHESEIEQALAMSAMAFGNREGVAAAVERGRGLYAAERYLGAFDGPEMAAFMRVLPSRMRINGGSMSVGLVTPVVSSHLYRRRGYAAAMLRRSLEQMRESEQWLSALYTPHPALYRRYGWEIAADERIYKFKPKDLQLTSEPAQRGRLRYLTGDDWPELDAVHRVYAQTANGALDRDELWWRNWVMRTWFGSPDAIVWENDAGLPEGYVLYLEPGWSSRDGGKFIVPELVSVSSDATLNLLGLLGQQDIRDEVVYYAPSDDPLPLLFADEERLKIEQHHTVLLRVVDVAGALTERRAIDAGSALDFSLEVTDAYAPWNEGTWRVRSSGKGTTVERVNGAGDLRLDVRLLGSLINGYLSPSTAASAGLVRAADSSALPQIDRFFAASRRPFFPDRF